MTENQNIWIDTFKSEHYQRQLRTKMQFMYGKYVLPNKCFPYVKITILSPLVWNTFYWMCMCIGNDIGRLAESVRFHILSLLGGWFIETNVLILLFFLLILIILIPSQNPISGDADKRQDRNKCPLLGVPKRECWLWCQISHYESTERQRGCIIRIKWRIKDGSPFIPSDLLALCMPQKGVLTSFGCWC